MRLLSCFKKAFCLFIMFINTLPNCSGHILFALDLVKGKEESPVDMDTITLDPEEEVRRWSTNITAVWL